MLLLSSLLLLSSPLSSSGRKELKITTGRPWWGCACVWLEEANYTFLNAVNEHLYNTHSNSYFMECWAASLAASAHRPLQIIVLFSLTERSPAVMTSRLIRGHKLITPSLSLILSSLPLLLFSFNCTAVLHTSWHNYKQTYYWCLFVLRNNHTSHFRRKYFQFPQKYNLLSTWFVWLKLFSLKIY